MEGAYRTGVLQHDLITSLYSCIQNLKAPCCTRFQIFWMSDVGPFTSLEGQGQVEQLAGDVDINLGEVPVMWICDISEG